MNRLHPSDIAQIISEVSHKDRRAIVESLDIETAAETIHELEPSVQADHHSPDGRGTGRGHP